jgi:dCMP deaminase
MERPTKKDYYLNIAEVVAQRSTCIRRQYGAVIVQNDVIVSTGYNGAPRGADNCCDKGECWREENNIPHGERYEECQAVHAEVNAIMNANPVDRVGATLYLVGLENGKRIEKPMPCKQCEKAIRNAQIRWVVS